MGEINTCICSKMDGNTFEGNYRVAGKIVMIGDPPPPILMANPN
jgi:hypothetical protein